MIAVASIIEFPPHARHHGKTYFMVFIQTEVVFQLCLL